MPPIEIKGPWKKGYALDIHTLSSEKVGEYADGRPKFESKRSLTGEALYLLKYRSDKSQVEFLTKQAVDFLKSQKWAKSLDGVTYCPPTTKRQFQPMAVLCRSVSNALGIEIFVNYLGRDKKIEKSLKDVQDKDEKLDLLKDAYQVIDAGEITDKTVLLIDDIFHTGATAEIITNLLLSNGAKAVFLLYFTKRRGA